MTILGRHVAGADKEALFAAARLFAMTRCRRISGSPLSRRCAAACRCWRREVGMSEIVRAAGAGWSSTVARRHRARPGRAAGRRGHSRAMGERGRAHVVAHFGWPARRAAHGGALSLGRQRRAAGRSMIDLLARSPFDLATERRS